MPQSLKLQSLDGEAYYDLDGYPWGGTGVTIGIYGSLFLSPHSHISSNIGMSDFPRSVKLYSTFGGI